MMTTINDMLLRSENQIERLKKCERIELLINAFNIGNLAIMLLSLWSDERWWGLIPLAICTACTVSVWRSWRWTKRNIRKWESVRDKINNVIKAEQEESELQLTSAIEQLEAAIHDT